MDMFYAIAEPTRRSILEMLASGGQLSATEICDRFTVSHPAISQHLKVLREAKLVFMEKRAQKHLYKLNPDSMIEIEKWAKQMVVAWDERFDALDRVLIEEKRNLLRNKAKKGNKYGKQRLW